MLGWFVETTLVASGLAVVAAMASRLGSIGPTARHLLWLVVLVRLVTPPLVCWPWAAHWGGQSWPRISPEAASVVCADESASAPTAPVPEATTLPALDPRAGLKPSHKDFRIASAPTERGLVDSGGADPDAPESPRRVLDSAAKPDQMARLPVKLTFGWLFLTVLVGIGQASRIIRFRARIRAAVPAPEDLVDEAERIGRFLGVRVPELLVVPNLHTPLLWCLGRPKLLLPAQLVKALELDGWRGILTHELAHIRRRDHWVSRLELAAGLIWWWNPIYWLARTRLDAEAELACDAWVVSTLPKDRLAYAEVLLNILSTLSMAKVPAPALGAAVSGRFFERRLTMILHGHASCRLSPPALLAACLLVLFALPSWSMAQPVASQNGETAVAALVSTVKPISAASVTDDDDDADDDEANEAAIAKAKADIKKAEATLKKIKAAKKAKAGAKKAKADGKEKKGGVDFDFSELGEKIEKEIESTFGPDFEKKMEELGEKIGKDMETKLGPGSDFENKLKKLGKEMEARFGRGSEFERKMSELGKEMEAKFGPGSDFEKTIKEQAEKLSSDLQSKAGMQGFARMQGFAPKGGPATRSAKKTAKAPAAGKDRQRERRIAALEAQIRKLADELKALKADDDQD